MCVFFFLFNSRRFSSTVFWVNLLAGEFENGLVFLFALLLKAVASSQLDFNVLASDAAMSSQTQHTVEPKAKANVTCSVDNSFLVFSVQFSCRFFFRSSFALALFGFHSFSGSCVTHAFFSYSVSNCLSLPLYQCISFLLSCFIYFYRCFYSLAQLTREQLP